jgi:hypothetical protein
VHVHRPPPHAAAVAANGDYAAMRAASLPFNRNRAWEQATIFSSLALRGVAGSGTPFLAAGQAVGADAASRSAVLHVLGTGSAVAGADSTGETTRHSPDRLDPLAYADAMHTQTVPQAWLNSYPPEIATRLHDHRGGALHATYEAGDWMISFSGCGVLLPRHECEVLFAAYAEEAGRALQVWKARQTTTG